MSAILGSGSNVQNMQFRGAIDGSMSRVDASAGATRIREALDSVNMNNLSTQEKNVLMSTIDTLAADGYISDADANTVVGMINSFQSTGRVFDTLLGGNGGQLDVPQGHQGWNPSDSLRGAVGNALGTLIGNGTGTQPWVPSPIAQAAAKFPTNPLFGGLLGFSIDKVVQTFKDALFMGASKGMLNTCDGCDNQQRVSDALDKADLSKMSPEDRTKVLSQIGFAALDGHVSKIEADAIIDTLNKAQGIVPTKEGPWEVKQDGGKAHIDLGNYTLDLNEGNSEFILTNKETGEKTRIWGDPHFEVDGKAVGDFYGTMTLNLDDGTKITIHTTPYDQNKNMTLSTELVITKGDQAMVIQGLDQNTLGDLQIGQVSKGGQLVDWVNDDGVNIYEDAAGGGWQRMTDGGYMTKIDRDFLGSIRDDVPAGSTPNPGANANHGNPFAFGPFFTLPIFTPTLLTDNGGGTREGRKDPDPVPLRMRAPGDR
ncbi:DUF1521 domain-containing protein [Dokdonella sp.]|uniref:DUF1521 domain-containing protein n=1 Tax=Dokdonella sp. TaxID=2291710 RepID=UPI0026055B5B|nr:DUF1521 domain-containing protein [Dokdonella sp.]